MKIRGKPLINPKMKISDIKAGEGKISIEAAVIDIGEARDINKYGKNLRVATATIQDDSGKIKLSLWNQEVDKVKKGDKVKITDGYASEFKGEKQLTAGKFGKLEVVGQASEEEMQVSEEIQEPVRTNVQIKEEAVDGMGEESEDSSEEEW
jgi:replication factor A1